MHSSLVFPYGITLNEGGIVNIFPAAEVQCESREGGWLSLFFVIDSGAVISALPMSDASSLGIVPETGISMHMKGIGREMIMGWKHEIGVRVGEEKIRLPIAFLDSSPRILGRAGIFDRFTIVFEEDQRRTGFLGKGTKESKAMKNILEKVRKST